MFSSLRMKVKLSAHCSTDHLRPLTYDCESVIESKLFGLALLLALAHSLTIDLYCSDKRPKDTERFSVEF